MNDPITLQLIDAADNLTYDLLEVPLQQDTIDGKTNIETLDGNVFTYVTYDGKRRIVHTWAYMSDEEYQRLKAFERRQYSTFLRPLLTIPRLGIENMPVVVDITTPQKIINNCGVVQGVTLTLRETIQNSIGA